MCIDIRLSPTNNLAWILPFNVFVQNLRRSWCFLHHSHDGTVWSISSKTLLLLCFLWVCFIVIKHCATVSMSMTMFKILIFKSYIKKPTIACEWISINDKPNKTERPIESIQLCSGSEDTDHSVTCEIGKTNLLSVLQLYSFHDPYLDQRTSLIYI
jgi:hypothetical protein